MRSDLVVSSDRNDHPQQDSSFAFVQNRTSKIDIDYPETIYGDFNPYEDIHITEEKEDQFFEVSGAGSERTNHRLVQKVLITTFVIILFGIISFPFFVDENGRILAPGLQMLEKNAVAMYHRNVQTLELSDLQCAIDENKNNAGPLKCFVDEECLGERKCDEG